SPQAGTIPVERKSGNLFGVRHAARIVCSIGCAMAIAGAALADAQDAKESDVLVRIETSLGTIDVAVDAKHAPITAANFLQYADAKLYDRGGFHRATPPPPPTPR